MRYLIRFYGFHLAFLHFYKAICQIPDPGSLAGMLASLDKPTTPASTGDDIDRLIDQVFHPETTTKPVENRDNAADSDDCECVPYYQCQNGTILENGVGLIDIRLVYTESLAMIQNIGYSQLKRLV